MVAEVPEYTSRSSDVEVRWTKPRVGLTKCNVSSSWINTVSLYGGAWILRGHLGNALLHSRDAFLATNSRIVAELKCVIWALEGLRDSHCRKVEMISDNATAIAAILKPHDWPRYRYLLAQIDRVRIGFEVCEFR